MECKIETTMEITIDGTHFANTQSALDYVIEQHRIKNNELALHAAKAESAEHELHLIEDTIGRLNELEDRNRFGFLFS